ncbi:MAG: putative Ribokinase [Candidatus Saccharibacteria bacterium]|nr:putative Ribokinase [Candidatus Saccharibacteria bacterium]
MSNIDVFSIGDIVTDAFIRLLDDQAHTYVSDDKTYLSMPFGTKVPFDHAEVKEAVGNAANASVSFARLGLNSGLIANVGHDQHGRDMITALHTNKVDPRYVHINPGKVSNYHYVLWYKEERTILIKHEEYDYHWPVIHKTDMPKWVYFSSISKNSLPFHDDVAEWLHDNPDVKFAFQPGTFQMQDGAVRLKKLYQRCNVLILNREEAVTVGGGDHKNVHDLFDKLHALGPKTILISDGPSGAYASGSEGRFFMPIYPDPAPPVERTGAGDAFASTFVAALMKGEDLQEALRWGPINSMNVVQHVGAQDGLLTEAQLKTLLKNAPEWYHASPF